MKVKGFTLIETIIAMVLLVVCVVGFIEGLNTGVLGTHRVRMSNAALELVRSQLEYLKQQPYIVYIDGNPVEWNASSSPPGYEPTEPYLNVSERPPEMADAILTFTVNATQDAEGNEIDPAAMQEIMVSVLYDTGHHRSMELVGYKSPRLGAVSGSAGRGWLLTEIIENIPELPAIGLGTNFYGYYYTFEIGSTTGEPGPVSVTWTFDSAPLNIADLYLYEYNATTAAVFGEGAERIRVRPADLPPHIEHVSSWWGWGETHLSAMEKTDLEPGKYTVFFYNGGFLIFSFYTIEPSTGTVTYFK